MKLVYLHQYFSTPENSGGTRSYDLSKQFIKLGIDVTIITTSASLKNIKLEKKWTYLEIEELKIWVLKSNYNNKLSIPQRIISFFKFVIYSSAKITKMRADLVLATSTPLTIVLPALWKKFISKTPFIFEVRDVWPEGPIQQGYVNNKVLIYLLRKLEKFIYKKASYVVALSTGMKKDILSRIKLDRVEVIPNISELDRFKDVSTISKIDYNFNNRKTILYAGTLGPVNDIMYVARLAKIMIKLNPQISFLIVGDGKERKKIIDYCNREEINEKNIFFRDPINKNQLPHLYNQVTMGSSFVWDYKIKWDNSANKFFDTLASGRPILINYQGWQKDIIEKYNCGYVLPYDFTRNDVEKFSQYLNNESLLSQHGINALKAAEQFSLTTATQKYINIFKLLGFNV